MNENQTGIQKIPNIFEYLIKKCRNFVQTGSMLKPFICFCKMNHCNYVEALDKRYRDYLNKYRVRNDTNKAFYGEQVFEEPDH